MRGAPRFTHDSLASVLSRDRDCSAWRNGRHTLFTTYEAARPIVNVAAYPLDGLPVMLATRIQAVGEDSVAHIRRRVRAPRCIDAGAVHLGVHGIGKRNLRRPSAMPVARDLDVNVRGPALIPARIDGREFHLSARIRRLNAAQIGLRPSRCRIASSCRVASHCQISTLTSVNGAQLSAVLTTVRSGPVRAAFAFSDVAAEQIDE